MYLSIYFTELENDWDNSFCYYLSPLKQLMQSEMQTIMFMLYYQYIYLSEGELVKSYAN